MNQDEATTLLRNLAGIEETIFKTKGAEYSDGQDVLSNFKHIGQMLGMSPLQVCLVYMTKHYLSIAAYVRNVGTLSDESLDSRVVDLRLYLALFLALATEGDNGV